MKKMKRRTQRNILLGICVLAVIFLIVLLIRELAGLQQVTQIRQKESGI